MYWVTIKYAMTWLSVYCILDSVIYCIRKNSLYPNFYRPGDNELGGVRPFVCLSKLSCLNLWQEDATTFKFLAKGGHYQFGVFVCVSVTKGIYVDNLADDVNRPLIFLKSGSWSLIWLIITDVKYSNVAQALFPDQSILLLIDCIESLCIRSPGYYWLVG